MNTSMHRTQINILKELLFNNGANFAALNTTGLTNDLFTFHLKKLVEEGWVYKDDKKYFLTQQGKVLAGTIDTEKVRLEEWGKPSVAVTTKRIVNGKPCLLMHKRKKEPFLGYYGFINGKVRYGEKTEATAVREFKEETGLTGKPNFIGVYHKLRGPNEEDIVLDNFFFLYIMKDISGELIDTNEGTNHWIPEDEIKNLKTFPGFEWVLDSMINEKYLHYFERFIKVDNI